MMASRRIILHSRSALRRRCLGSIPRSIFPPSVIIPRSPIQPTSTFSTTTKTKTAADEGSTTKSKIIKNQLFKSIDAQDIIHFLSVLPSASSILLSSSHPAVSSIQSYKSNPSLQIVDQQDLETFNHDWMHKYKGSSQIVLKPRTSEEVASILKYCNDKSIAVVPQGGNTGLVGGSVPVFDELILSLNNMNQIHSFNPKSGILTCDAGCILEDLDNYVAEHGYMMPLDLGAKGSCHIGGNVATNAGGLRLLRYGSLHGTVLGLEVVLPDGRILSNLSGLRKDNTGYFLHHLFIGGEGTLGIITKVCILAPPKPKSVQVALLQVNPELGFHGVTDTFVKAKQELGEILSAFEFWDQTALDMTLEKLSYLRNPFSETTDAANNNFYILIETSGSSTEHDSEKLSQFLETLFSHDQVIDGVIAQDETQTKNFWGIREGIPEACSKQGVVYKYDISLPIDQVYELVNVMKKRLSEAGVYQEGAVVTTTHGDNARINSVIGYGHLGDGNLHLNISATKYSPRISELLEPFIYEWTAQHRGSISAEHGLGVMKAKHLHYSKEQPVIEAMKEIKKLWDPKGILNPYKFLP